VTGLLVFAQARAGREIRRGWHVLVAGRFRLVATADPAPGRMVALTFAGGDSRAVRVGRAQSVWTRTPGEQIAFAGWEQQERRLTVLGLVPRGAVAA